MSHVVVGERLAGMAPEIIGHVIAGGGHFLQVAEGLIQQFSQSGNVIPMIANRGINDLSNAVALENWQWNQLQQNYGTGSLLAASDHESRAAEQALIDSINASFENKLDASKDFLVAAGSFMAGDVQTGVENTISSIEKFTNGFLKDMGFNNGWNSGPFPGQGTCPPFPDNGR